MRDSSGLLSSQQSEDRAGPAWPESLVADGRGDWEVLLPPTFAMRDCSAKHVPPWDKPGDATPNRPPPPVAATHLAKEVLPVDAGRGVALQLHLGCGGLQRLCLGDAGDIVVGAFNPVAPKLGQQDKGEGPFSPQNLKSVSVKTSPRVPDRPPPHPTWT